MSNFLKFNRRQLRFRKKKFPSIKFYFPAGEARPVPPLGPVIAMFQLNMAQVCKDLNEASVNFPQGLSLAAKVYKIGPKIHRIFIGAPTLKILLENEMLARVTIPSKEGITNDDEETTFVPPSGLPIEAVFDVARVHGIFINKSTRSSAISLFSTLRSMSYQPIQRILFLFFKKGYLKNEAYS